MFSAFGAFEASLEAGMCLADQIRNSCVAVAHRSRSAPSCLSVSPSRIASRTAIVSAASLHPTCSIQYTEMTLRHRGGVPAGDPPDVINQVHCKYAEAGLAFWVHFWYPGTES